MSLQHLTSIKPKYIEFEIQGEKYKAKSLTNSEYKEFQKEIAEVKSNGTAVYHAENVQTALIFHTLCGEDGERLFKLKSDRALLDNIPQTIISEIFEYASEANGMNTVEKEIKN